MAAKTTAKKGWVITTVGSIVLMIFIFFIKDLPYSYFSSYESPLFNPWTLFIIPTWIMAIMGAAIHIKKGIFGKSVEVTDIDKPFTKREFLPRWVQIANALFFTAMCIGMAVAVTYVFWYYGLI